VNLLLLFNEFSASLVRQVRRYPSILNPHVINEELDCFFILEVLA